jgi:hypothetical protein
MRPEQARPGVDQGQPVSRRFAANPRRPKKSLAFLSLARLSEKMPSLFHLFYQVPRSGPPPSIELLHHYCEYHIIANLSISGNTNSDLVTERIKSSGTTPRSDRMCA